MYLYMFIYAHKFIEKGVKSYGTKPITVVISREKMVLEL